MDRGCAVDLRGHADSSPARSVVNHHLDVHAADLDAVAASLGTEVAVAGGVSLEAHAAARTVASGAVSASTLLACLPAWLRETLVTDDARHDAASLTAALAALAGGAAPDAAELERLEA